MSDLETNVGPMVFISFAAADRQQAQRLARDLAELEITTFLADEDIDPGANIVSSLSHALEQSDYVVLLLSAISRQRRWVEAEWTSALHRELNERRAFLFILRLDETPPPMLLAARKYLDAFSDWEEAVQALARTWSRDWHLRRREIGVFPAPGPSGSPERDSLGIYVFNEALSVQHFLHVPPRLSTRQLYARVRSALVLQDSVDALGGKVGLRFTYELARDGVTLSSDEATAIALTDGDTLDLTVLMEPFGPEVSSESVRYRDIDGSRGLNSKMTNQLVVKAFGHLVPERAVAANSSHLLRS